LGGEKERWVGEGSDLLFKREKGGALLSVHSIRRAGTVRAGPKQVTPILVCVCVCGIKPGPSEQQPAAVNIVVWIFIAKSSVVVVFTYEEKGEEKDYSIAMKIKTTFSTNHFEGNFKFVIL